VNKALTGVAALVAALAVCIPGAFGRTHVVAPQATPGVTKSSIVIGGTFPLSGIASLYAPIPRGMEAYFNYINNRKGKDGKKGIHGRKIVWKYYDDAYNPAQTVQLTNKLILDDKIFADVGSLGTEPTQAARPILNQRKIPQIFVATGASYWGLQYKEFPWTIGWQPDYIAEGRAYGEWIRKTAPNAKIAVFLQNDDYGKDYLRGLNIGLGKKKNLIVSQQSYELSDASYGSQIARQKASGADTWVLLTTPTPTVRAIATAKALNWKPATIVINSVSAIDAVMGAAIQRAGADFVAGAVSSAYLKNTFYYYGMAKAYDVVKVLNGMKTLSRPALMRAVLHMNWTNPWTIKGVRIKTSPRDHFPISQIKLIRYESGHFREFGSLIKGR
jgi:branched-chain amino acid transport system substrate-binding protein